MQWTDRLGGHNVTLVDTAKWPFFALGQFVATPTFSFSEHSYHTIQVSAKNLVDAELVLWLRPVHSVDHGSLRPCDSFFRFSDGQRVNQII